MVVKVSPVHEVQDEAELVGGVEGVGHADDEGAVVARGHLQDIVLLQRIWYYYVHQAQHDPLVQGQGLALLHLDAFFVQTLKQNIN